MLCVYILLTVSLLHTSKSALPFSNAKSKTNMDIWRRLKNHDVSLKTSLSGLRLSLKEDVIVLGDRLGVKVDGIVDTVQKVRSDVIDEVQQVRSDVTKEVQQVRSDVTGLTAQVESIQKKITIIEGSVLSITENLDALKDRKDRKRYEYIGCYKDTGNNRAMHTPMFRDDMTTEMCYAYCKAKGQPYFATQLGRDCWCGGYYARHGRASNCNVGCTGDPKTICGGKYANSVYKFLV